MDNHLVSTNELQNDGKTIHLYFSREVGLYLAYGFSAFFVTHFLNVITAFSEELQMPVALLRKSEVSELRLFTIKREHDYHRYYRLELKQSFPLNDYKRWAQSTKWEE